MPHLLPRAFGLVPYIAYALAAAPSTSEMALLPTSLPHLRSAATLCASDAHLVGTRIGQNVSSHQLRVRLITAGVTKNNLDATHSELVRSVAAAIRALSALPLGAKLNNITALRACLEAKGESFPQDAAASTLLDRLEERMEKECFVINPMRPLSQSLALEDLQAAASERMLSTSGTRTDLINRLHTFQRRCDRMVDTIPGFACTLGRLEDALGARGLSKVGSKEELMARLVESVDAGKKVSLAQASTCTLSVPGPICIDGGKKVIAADAAPRGMVARFTFDDAHGLDSSGKHNHAEKAPEFGPGVGGHGHAARFVGTDMLEIRNHPAYSGARDTFSLEMWMYLRQDSTGEWRTVVHKGGRDEERTPTLFLEPLTRGLEFFVSTTDANQPMGERLWSNSFIPLHRWTHVAAIAEGHSLRLYINGLLDSENTTVGTILQNTGPLFLGGDPWRSTGGFDGYIDEFKFYSRALTTDEVQAAASFALGGVEPSFLELGCMGCPLDSARTTCRSGYHLCNTRDMYSGGLMAARAMGWATSNSHIWTAEEAAAGGSIHSSWTGAAPGTVKQGLGLCCIDTD
ncbi:hypothetical protein AB1Y20_009998 [Prymnesium parvum]|uniref:SAP domain-containing protein n=1 Tax=Prymnesium parvum TaxID=97485 RepID=A0AB34K702_PRYPA